MTELTKAEATARVEAAIQDLLAIMCEGHEHAEGQTGMLTDWIIVAAEVYPSQTGPAEDTSAYSVCMSQGGMPWHRAYGLLHAGLSQL